jgi:uroporphyrinogen III methyltransferase/synthase
MDPGKVYLVGAGPGDPKLITLRGLEVLQRADCVVYDRLAGPQLLRKAKEGAELIYVGKLPDRHTMKQEEISQLLVDLAKQGKTVVRLKGGDPAVFGRVGEEAELLRKNGIAYEIIPGITSAIAVPAYAGIPVTHRGLAASFMVITGHESPDKLDQLVEWDKIAHTNGTLVFLMGVAKIGYIAWQLMRFGKRPDTPVALVRWGTRAEQATLTGTLADIEAKVRETGFEPPAVIIVGDVVRCRQQMAWAEQKPLFGQRVLITRTKSQAGELADKIYELGGEPYEFPVIETRMPQAPETLQAVREALDAAESYDWVVLTSVNGVQFFFDWLVQTDTDIRRFHRARFAAVGPKTAEELARRGVRADLQAAKFVAEGLAEAIIGQAEPGQKVLLPRGDLARDVLPRELEKHGLITVKIDIYETVPAETRDPFLMDMLENGDIHVVTFTSASTVRNLLDALRRMGSEDPAALLGKSRIACIGPIAAKEAENHGLNVSAIAEPYTLDGLVQAICKLNAKEGTFKKEGE